MKLNTAILTVFFADALAAAQNAVGKKNSKQARDTDNSCHLNIIMWTGSNCNGNQHPHDDISYPGWYGSSQENHSLELVMNRKDCYLDPDVARLWLKGKTCDNDLAFYVYGAAGCVHNLPAFTCIEFRGQASSGKPTAVGASGPDPTPQ